MSVGKAATILYSVLALNSLPLEARAGDKKGFELTLNHILISVIRDDLTEKQDIPKQVSNPFLNWAPFKYNLSDNLAIGPYFTAGRMGLKNNQGILGGMAAFFGAWGGEIYVGAGYFGTWDKNAVDELNEIYYRQIRKVYESAGLPVPSIYLKKDPLKNIPGNTNHGWVIEFGASIYI